MIMSNCRTISVLLAGVAIVMGAGRVFIAGMDGYLDKNFVTSTLFYNEKFDTNDYELNLERHKWNERYLNQIDKYIREHGGEGIHIITPTSHSSFHKKFQQLYKLKLMNRFEELKGILEKGRYFQGCMWCGQRRSKGSV